MRVGPRVRLLVLLVMALAAIGLGGALMRRRSKSSKRISIPKASPEVSPTSSLATFILGETNHEKRAQFEVNFDADRVHISLRSSPEFGAPRHGRFEVVLPSARVPVTNPIDLAVEKKIAALNDFSECGLAVDEKTWAVVAIVVDELRLEDTILTLRLRGALALSVLDDDEAIKRLEDAGEDDSAIERALSKPRIEPFALAVRQRVRVRGGPARTRLGPLSTAPKREETFDVSTGLGQIRWSDNLATVKLLYPDGIERQGAKAKNHQTGESIVISTTLEVGGFLETSSGTLLDAVVRFDPEDLTVTGTMLRFGDFAGAGDQESKAAPKLIEWYRKRLGLSEGTCERTEADGEFVEETWKRGPMTVTLRRAKDNSFALLEVRRSRS